jgi:hypothetical protein
LEAEREQGLRPLHGIQQHLFGLAIAAKRYALFRRTLVGDIHIPKASAYGLGFLYHPRRKDDPDSDVPPWVREAWDWILRAPSIRLELNQPGFASRQWARGHRHTRSAEVVAGARKQTAIP